MALVNCADMGPNTQRDAATGAGGGVFIGNQSGNALGGASGGGAGGERTLL